MNEKGYHKLIAWKEAHLLTVMIYKISRQFPKEEIYGLTSQLRRAAVSVTANIVEGQARSSKKEFRQFLSISNGSLVECEYYLELARELQYLNDEEYQKLETQRAKTGYLVHALARFLHT